MRAPFIPRSLLLIALLLLGWVAAQEAAVVRAFERGSTVYVEVPALARALGVVANVDTNVLTWRGPGGPVTLFAGSADALAHFPGDAGPTDVALAAPVLSVDGVWYVPLDALALLGVEVPFFEGRLDSLPLGNGRTALLEYGVVDAAAGTAPLAPVPGVPPSNGQTAGASIPGAQPSGAPTPGTTGRASWEAAEEPLAGVRFFDGDGASLLLVDLALVPLAEPALTGDVDVAMDRAREAGGDHVLLLMVTAVAELPWDPHLVFEQDGRRLEVSTPYRVVIEQGEEERVAPGSPVIGAVLLPAGFSLYRDMLVEWAGVQAVVRFRK